MNIKRIISTFIIAVVASFFAVIIALKFIDKKPKIITVEQKEPVYFTSNTQGISENINFVNAANSSINSVVHVKTQYVQENSYNSLYDFFFGSGSGQTYSSPVISSGSGVIISSDGYIITNNHVIQNSTNIEVILNDKSSYKAKIIGTDPNTDIALLKIEKTNLPVIKYGNSDNLKIGEWVLA
ncbi:MAG: deoxyribonuclease HsdR, partial [Bacteroidetes bacterium]